MNGPTILTVVRMFLSILFMVFAMIPENWARITALAIFIIASLTDLVDGKWARKKKIVTDLGAFLDPLADKMLVNLAFLVLTYLNVVPLWMFAVILVRDFAVDGMRMMSAKKNITISASIFGKIKTTVQMLTISLIILNLILNFQILTQINNILLYIVIILTLYSGFDYLIKGWKRLIK